MNTSEESSMGERIIKKINLFDDPQEKSSSPENTEASELVQKGKEAIIDIEMLQEDSRVLIENIAKAKLLIDVTSLTDALDNKEISEETLAKAREMLSKTTDDKEITDLINHLENQYNLLSTAFDEIEHKYKLEEGEEKSEEMPRSQSEEKEELEKGDEGLESVKQKLNSISEDLKIARNKEGVYLRADDENRRREVADRWDTLMNRVLDIAETLAPGEVDYAAIYDHARHGSEPMKRALAKLHAEEVTASKIEEPTAEEENQKEAMEPENESSLNSEDEQFLKDFSDEMKSYASYIEEHREKLEDYGWQIENILRLVNKKIKVAEESLEVGELTQEQKEELAQELEDYREYSEQSRADVAGNISKEEYEAFWQSGEISEVHLAEIVQKISKGERLSKREQSVYGQKTEEIEKSLQDLHGSTSAEDSAEEEEEESTEATSEDQLPEEEEDNERADSKLESDKRGLIASWSQWVDEFNKKPSNSELDFIMDMIDLELSWFEGRLDSDDKSQIALILDKVQVPEKVLRSTLEFWNDLRERFGLEPLERTEVEESRKEEMEEVEERDPSGFSFKRWTAEFNNMTGEEKERLEQGINSAGYKLEIDKQRSIALLGALLSRGARILDFSEGIAEFFSSIEAGAKEKAQATYSLALENQKKKEGGTRTTLKDVASSWDRQTGLFRKSVGAMRTFGSIYQERAQSAVKLFSGAGLAKYPLALAGTSLALTRRALTAAGGLGSMAFGAASMSRTALKQTEQARTHSENLSNLIQKAQEEGKDQSKIEEMVDGYFSDSGIYDIEEEALARLGAFEETLEQKDDGWEGWENLEDHYAASIPASLIERLGKEKPEFSSSEFAVKALYGRIEALARAADERIKAIDGDSEIDTEQKEKMKKQILSDFGGSETFFYLDKIVDEQGHIDVVAWGLKKGQKVSENIVRGAAAIGFASVVTNIAESTPAYFRDLRGVIKWGIPGWGGKIIEESPTGDIFVAEGDSTAQDTTGVTIPDTTTAPIASPDTSGVSAAQPDTVKIPVVPADSTEVPAVSPDTTEATGGVADTTGVPPHPGIEKVPTPSVDDLPQDSLNVDTLTTPIATPDTTETPVVSDTTGTPIVSPDTAAVSAAQPDTVKIPVVPADSTEVPTTPPDTTGAVGGVPGAAGVPPHPGIEQVPAPSVDDLPEAPFEFESLGTQRITIDESGEGMIKAIAQHLEEKQEVDHEKAMKIGNLMYLEGLKEHAEAIGNMGEKGVDIEALKELEASMTEDRLDHGEWTQKMREFLETEGIDASESEAQAELLYEDGRMFNLVHINDSFVLDLSKITAEELKTLSAEEIVEKMGVDYDSGTFVSEDPSPTPDYDLPKSEMEPSVTEAPDANNEVSERVFTTEVRTDYVEKLKAINEGFEAEKAALGNKTLDLEVLEEIAEKQAVYHELLEYLADDSRKYDSLTPEQWELYESLESLSDARDFGVQEVKSSLEEGTDMIAPEVPGEEKIPEVVSDQPVVEEAKVSTEEVIEDLSRSLAPKSGLVKSQIFEALDAIPGGADSVNAKAVSEIRRLFTESPLASHVTVAALDDKKMTFLGKAINTYIEDPKNGVTKLPQEERETFTQIRDYIYAALARRQGE